MNRAKFLAKYNFCIRVTKSCKNIEQFNVAKKLSWLYMDRNWSTFDLWVWDHLKVMAIELDKKKKELTNQLDN